MNELIADSSPTVPVAFRRSAVSFDKVPVEIERRNGFDVVLDYEDDAATIGGAPSTRLVDLSHRRRWDFQHRYMDEHRPFELEVPSSPGEVAIHGELMINRMNGTQASIWHVGVNEPPTQPEDVGITETTDSHCWLALVGTGVASVLEHVTNLDLFPPGRSGPFLTQGPVLHVPCQIVTWRSDCVLIAFSRGYGQPFVDACLHTADDAGFVPGGERFFTDWVSARGEG